MTAKNLSILSKRHLVVAGSIVLVAIGLGLLFGPMLRFSLEKAQGTRANATYWAQHSQSQTQPVPVKLGVPVSMTVPRLKIALDIVPGNYSPSSQQWKLDRTHAFYILPGTTPLQSSAVPLIYGHDIPAVFENFGGIAPGEVMYVKNDTGKTLVFRYVNEDVVNPEQGAQLNARTSDGKSLNLLTCTGRWFTQRRIMHFQYVGTLRTDGSVV